MNKFLTWIIIILLAIISMACRDRGQNIFEAVRSGNLEQIKKLAGTDPRVLDTTDDQGYTPLHHAVKDTNHAVLELLIGLGADIMCEMPDSTTALEYAVAHNDPLSAEMLFLNENNREIIFREGNEVYRLSQEAIKGKYYSIAELLMWPMHYIVKRDRPQYFDHLVSVDRQFIRSRDMRMMTPLHTAYIYQNERFIRLLRAAGATDTMDAYQKKPEDYLYEKFDTMIAVNTLDEKTRTRLDDKMFDFLIHHKWLTLGVIREGKIVYLRSYGEKNMIDADAVHASVSKPMTGMIFLQLVREGMIKSVDDPISAYAEKYRHVMPEKYAGDEITFRHLLTHTSGIPHINQPLWAGGKLNLLFKPGTKKEYTTNGYCVLGEVMEEVTGEEFSDLVKKYIGQPIHATSFRAEDVFRAPGARIHSTTRDFARFAEALINNVYGVENEFYRILLGKSKENSLGWEAGNYTMSNLRFGHSGSNGKPRSHFLVKPGKKLGIVLMGETKDPRSDIWFVELAPILMDILEGKGGY
jgi:CubicO group peptidase (beta-lactamase class C family)